MRLVTLLCAVACITACTGKIDQPLPSLQPTYVSVGGHSDAQLVFRVRVPQHADFISPSTKGMTVDISGPSKVKETAGLVLRANGCKGKLLDVSCDLELRGLKVCPSKKPCYTAVVVTYDAFNAATNKIPGSAKKLSADRLSFRIVAGTNVIPLVLQGIPKRVAFLPAAGSTLNGSQSGGFIEPKCTAKAENVTILGVDADGNYIFGAGAPRASLSSSDPKQLAVRAVPSEPGTFELVPPSAPAYAFGNRAIHMTATETPNKKSGAAAAHAVVNVTYSGEICGTITEFTVPTAAAGPHGLSAGPDGNVWFAEEGGKIGRITPAGSIAEFTVPTSLSRPFSIVTGPDGNLWFPELDGNKIGKITPSGAISEYALPTAAAEPTFITTGSDGNLWFSEIGANNIGKITPLGAITEYPISGAYANPGIITTGPDGNLWYDLGSGQLGIATTGGSLSAYATNAPPSGITTGPDGALWFAECATNKIARMTTSGVETSEYPLPEASSQPVSITRGPDNRLWFTELGGNRVGSIDPTGGNISEFAVPTGNSFPYSIAVGPDGALWFVETNANKIARIR